MRRALLVLVRRRAAQRRIAPRGRRRRIRPAVRATGRRRRRRPVPAARDPLRARQPRPRVRHRAGHAGARRSPTARSPSPGRWPAPCTSRCCTPTACAPPTRSSQRIDVVGRPARAPGRPGRARPTGTSTSAPGAATPTSTRRRCSAPARRRCTSCRSTSRPGDGEPGASAARSASSIGGPVGSSDGAGGAAGAVGTLAPRRRDAAARAPSTTTPVASPSRRRSSTAGLTMPAQAWQRARWAADRPVHRAGAAGAAASRTDGSRCWSPGWARTAQAPPSTRCAPTSSATRRPTSCASATPAGGCPIPPTASRRSRPPTTTPPRPRPTSAAPRRRLADLVEAMVAPRSPGVPIDLFAHSQGGRGRPAWR